MTNKNILTAGAVQVKANLQKLLTILTRTCKSMSRSTTFAMMPFDGKYKNLQKSGFNFLPPMLSPFPRYYDFKCLS